MFIPPFLQRWIILNSIRILTIVSCALFISATIRIVVLNFHHYPPPLISSSSDDSSSVYYPSTDIPTSFLGVFWSTLHHISLVLVLFTVILSELSLPIPLLHRLFKNTLPFLGPNWGTGFLGVLLILVAGDGLSRGNIGCKFKEASCWTLASAGVANAISGVVWRAKAKVVRSPMGWKHDVATKLEDLAEAKRTAERVVDGLPLAASFKRKGEAEKGAKGEEGGGLKGLVGMAGKMLDSQLEKRKEKKEAEERSKFGEKDVEMAQDAVAAPAPASAQEGGLSIFTPPLPSAIISSRTVPPPPVVTHATPPVHTIPIPTPSIPPQPTLTHRPPSSASSRSTYTLDLPPPSQPFATPLTSSTTTNDLTPTFPHHPTSPPPTKPPALKSVRFNHPTPQPQHLSRTIDSHHAKPEEVGVGTSKFLLLPPLHTPSSGDKIGLVEGERSPSVLASLKAAMLEAEAKAKAKPKQKSIYLGSNRWRAEYAGLGEGEVVNEKAESDKKGDKEKGDEKRPYNFV
ncbi:uncharacterized protein UTRI_01547_B [Ustilago trichophora]|uniref:Uncharacterized protein n=1 Tax=Ustilago trichophora TaxID=86804 RepID=A0A5C3E2T1_9BASI|nr:uncharacterized protein UTRI_01547_B [Ustilago trichophora]